MKKKILCVCQYGHSRSAALVRVLHGMGYEAICAGWATASEETLDLLITHWADKVVILSHNGVFAKLAQTGPAANWDKYITFDIGPDKWSNPYNQELLALCKKFAEETLIPSFQKETPRG